MDANLEIMRMKKEIIEAINKHKMPIAITVLLLKEILAETETQLDSALYDAIAKEKEEERKKEEKKKLAVICRESGERCEEIAISDEDSSELVAKCSSGNPKPSEATA